MVSVSDYGFDANRFLGDQCQISVNGVYQEMFRVMGLYPKSILFLVLGGFLLVFIAFLIGKRWEDLAETLRVVSMQMTAFACFLLLPATFGLSDEGLMVAYYVVCVVIVALIGVVVMKFYKMIRRDMERRHKTFKDILGEVPEEMNKEEEEVKE